MTETLTSEANVKLKAGANVSTALTSGNYTTFINMAESYLNSVCRINLVDAYSGLTTELKLILDDAASSYAANMAIQYDMSGYTSLNEAITLINQNWQIVKFCTQLLKDKKTTDFIGA